MNKTPRPFFGRGSWAETSRISDVLRQETVGGALLVLGAAIALVWANSPWAVTYDELRDFTIGPSALHLDLSLGTWAADGLLAIFFFVVGLELKREFVAGDLRDPARAALPIVAALGGVIVPALVYVAVNISTGGEALRGWAIPTATDIAFAVAVLAIISTHLPAALRTFLLTLAVVDDLIAVTIIAVVYTSELHLLPLAAALVPLGLFALLVQKRVRSWWLLLPLALTTWALVHESGVHATVAGVLLGFTVPVIRSRRGRWPGGGSGPRRALRAPAASAVGRVRGACLRILRRRGHHRRVQRAGRVLDRSGRAGHRRGPRDRQARGHPGDHLRAGAVHPGQPRRRAVAGGTCWGSGCWAGSGSRCRC